MPAIQRTGQPAAGWFTLALFNAALAKSKGRNGLAWWLVSLFLGPICTLVIVVAAPANPKSA